MRRKNARVWTALTVGIACLGSSQGCGDLGDEPLGQQQAALVNPTPEPGMDSVVAVIQERDDGTQGRCTATLIAPRVVLTAKHCVQSPDRDPSPAANIFVLIGPKLERGMTRHPVESIVTTPGRWSQSDDSIATDLRGYDVAVLTLPSPPASIEPMPVKLTSPSDEAGKSATMYGYGVTPSDPDNLSKMKQQAQVVRVEERTLVTFDTACGGDSGGPLVDARGALIGITHGSIGAGGQCATGKTTFSNRIDLYADLIQQSVASASSCGQGPEACGNGADDDCDGKVDEGCSAPGVEPVPEPPPAALPFVTLYPHCGYVGRAVRLPPGDFPAAGLELLGMPDNRLSSLELPAGVEAVLYTEDGYSGESLVVRASDSCLVQSNFNDVTTSIRIRRVAAP